MDMLAQVSASSVAENAQLAVLVAVIYGLIELVKILIKKIAPNAARSSCGFDADSASTLANLGKLHSQTDANGVPMWYTPRSWGDNQKEIANALRDVAETQREALKIVEQISTRECPRGAKK